MVVLKNKRLELRLTSELRPQPKPCLGLEPRSQFQPFARVETPVHQSTPRSEKQIRLPNRSVDSIDRRCESLHFRLPV